MVIFKIKQCRVCTCPIFSMGAWKFFLRLPYRRGTDWCSQILFPCIISLIEVEEGEKETRKYNGWHFALENKSHAIGNRYAFLSSGHFKYQDLHFVLIFPKDSTQSLHRTGNSEAACQSKCVEMAFCPEAKQNRSQTIWSNKLALEFSGCQAPDSFLHLQFAWKQINTNLSACYWKGWLCRI